MISRLRTRYRRSDRSGSISIEVAILMPVFMGLSMLATSFGQTTVDQPTVDLAAHNAARAASISRTDAGAQTAAEKAAEKTFADAGVTCQNTKPYATQVPTTQVPGPPPPPGAPPPGPPPPPDDGFDTPIGAAATVTYLVRCSVAMVDGAVPVTRDLWSVFTSPLDTYRVRG
jgi:hypothetical protein